MINCLLFRAVPFDAVATGFATATHAGSFLSQRRGMHEISGHLTSPRVCSVF